ncbi:hypothetical protein KIW84_012279, partial [Lathyrus oleraceus]
SSYSLILSFFVFFFNMFNKFPLQFLLFFLIFSCLLLSSSSSMYKKEIFFLSKKIWNHPISIFILLLKQIFIFNFQFFFFAGRIFTKDEKSSSMQTKLVKESAIGLIKGEDLFEAREELMVKERMNLEMDDYPGTGANNHHDPNAPGRV